MNYILYARYSPRPNAAECDSVEAQLHALRKHVQSHEGTVCGAFCDLAVSGGDDEREGLTNALEACRRGCVLLVTCSDRLARNFNKLEELAFLANQRGFCILALDGSIDTTVDTATSRLIRRIMGALAQYEREKTSERTSEAIKSKLDRGIAFNALAVPYGMRREGDRLVKDEQEQLVIKAVLKLRGEGMGYDAIAKELSRRDYRNRKGKADWYAMTVKRICDRAQAS